MRRHQKVGSLNQISNNQITDNFQSFNINQHHKVKSSHSEQKIQSKNKVSFIVSRSGRKRSSFKCELSNQEDFKMGNQKVRVRSRQQKQLMQIINPRVLPILVQSHSKSKSKNKRKSKSKKFHSQLDTILQNQKKFMRTYFQQLHHFRKTYKQESISYTFPEVVTKDLKIRGYIKGSYLLLKGVDKKQKAIVKKYEYNVVRAEIRSNYQKWAKKKFGIQNDVNEKM